jgi:hypothetical protein
MKGYEEFLMGRVEGKSIADHLMCTKLLLEECLPFEVLAMRSP